MRFLVVATPRFPVPPDQIMGVLDRGEEWHERIVNVRDEATLQQRMAEMPLAPFSDHEIRPFVDGPTGRRQAREAVASALAHV